MFATLTHIQRFGFFTGVTILVALLADFVVAPALMVVFTGQSRKAPETQDLEPQRHRDAEGRSVSRKA